MKKTKLIGLFLSIALALLLSGCDSTTYKQAEELMAKGDYSAAAALWKELGDYKDAEERLSEANQEISYQEATAYLAAQDYDQAFNAFSMLGSFRDSDTMAMEALYQKAEANLAAEQYREAAVIFEQLGDYSQAKTEAQEALYLYAKQLVGKYSYDRAASILQELGTYKDSAEQLSFLRAALQQRQSVSGADIGDMVCFGSYEQDGNESNGAEALSWLVLAKDEEKMLLVCRNAIETLPYHEDMTAVCWLESSLCSWLNGSFLQTAFSEEETAQLISISANGGRVFLLNTEEAELLGKEIPELLSAVPSTYAEQRGCSVRPNGGVCWWLRDRGFTGTYAAYVSSDGSINTTGIYCDAGRFCVRPAVWISVADQTEGTETEETESVADTAPAEETGITTDLHLGETPDVGQEYINNIIFMGDSTTYGYTNIGMPTSQLWSASSHTMSIFEQSYVNILTADGGMPIRDAAAYYKPEMMVITLGIRRISVMNEELFKSEYTDLVTGILEASPDTKIILNSVYPLATFLDRSAIVASNEMVDTVNLWIQDVAEATNVRYLDSNSALKGEDGFLKPEYARADGLHLTNEGLYVVLDVIRTHAYQ